MRNGYILSSVNFEDKGRYGNSYGHGMITIKWTIRKQSLGMWSAFNGLWIRSTIGLM
jgi:hypothetical protein